MTEEQLCHGRGGPRHYRLLRHAFFLKKLATRHSPHATKITTMMKISSLYYSPLKTAKE